MRPAKKKMFSFCFFLIKHFTIEFTHGRKNPIINIALIGPDKTPNKDKDA